MAGNAARDATGTTVTWRSSHGSYCDACKLYSSAYCPPSAIKDACVPDSITEPRAGRVRFVAAVTSVPAVTACPGPACVLTGSMCRWSGWTGLPSANNTRQVAQGAAPASRVVYVDNDRFKSGCAHAHRAVQTA
jgi:hypothetical protein